MAKNEADLDKEASRVKDVYEAMISKLEQAHKDQVELLKAGLKAEAAKIAKLEGDKEAARGEMSLEPLPVTSDNL